MESGRDDADQAESVGEGLARIEAELRELRRAIDQMFRGLIRRSLPSVAAQPEQVAANDEGPDAAHH